MKNQERIENYVKENTELAYKMLYELCMIPSPSYEEKEKAKYCVEKFKSYGFKDAYVDKQFNAVCPINCEGSDKITVLCGHIDTVFPKSTPLNYVEKDGKIFCPGVGDDTAAVVSILLIAKYFSENKLTSKDGLLLVCNACEESIGDLKGTERILKDYDGRIIKLVSLDSNLDKIFNDCVGSYKFELAAKVQGGHALSDFGRKNAIAVLAQIINEIYKISMPQKDGYIYSYNVGVIEGGRTVNAIAQEAKMHAEYRSNKPEYLKILKEKFDKIIDSVRADDVEISIKTLSDRHCSSIKDRTEQDKLTDACSDIIEEVIGRTPLRESASTDCNLPLSMGIPAVAIGVIEGENEHTTEEWIDKKSLVSGLKVAIAVAEMLGEV